VISAIVELTSNRLNDALSLLDQAAPLLDQVEDDAPLGCYHMERAIIFNRLGGVDNLDRALMRTPRRCSF